LTDDEDEARTRRTLDVCARRGLYGDDVFLVLALLDRPPPTWPACCESGCSPCMKDLHAAAHEVLNDSDVRDSDVRDSDVRDSDVRDSDVRESDVRESDVRDSDVRDSDVRDSLATDFKR
jgi:hypothetical protein